ncbi:MULTISPECIES: hypothetical protein [Streptomyces]|uniref:Uncharacterized protein n=2 Tax=Streptomyces TaxID=1883 RepID=A0ABV9IHS7_9ACTN
METMTCGCGEDHIPGMLARFGIVGTTVLVLGVLVVMLLAGWALAGVVWAVRRGSGDDGHEESFFDGFGRWNDENDE